jgi:hypothetical protein
MKPNSHMLDDIHDHFSDQLRRLVGDTADTCTRGGIEINDTLKLVISGLLFQAAFAACAHGFDEDDFLRVCGKAIRILLENADLLEQAMEREGLH